MQFAFTEDQLLFRDAMRDLLANECKPEAVRASWENGTGRIPGLWRKLVEMGVAALTAPEAMGGLGMNEVDLVLLHEEAGRWELVAQSLRARIDHARCKSHRIVLQSRSLGRMPSAARPASIA